MSIMTQQEFDREWKEHLQRAHGDKEFYGFNLRLIELNRDILNARCLHMSTHAFYMICLEVESYMKEDLNAN